MTESYYAGAYWGVRQESAEQCAHRASRFLTGLARIHTTFGRWYETGESREAATRQPIAADEQSLLDRLQKGRNRTDFGQKAMPELGFRLNLWTQEPTDGESSSLRITCGVYAPRPGVNSCVLNLPGEGARADQVLRVPILTSVLQTMVDAWQPDWAVVTSNTYQRTVPFPPSNAPRMGWLVYLSNARGTISELPPPFQVIPLQSGNIIVVTDERFTADNPDHVAAANHLAELLASAGVAGPLRQPGI